MPDFPRYSSKGQLTTQQPSVEAPIDNTGDVVAKTGNQIGGAIQEQSLKWAEAIDSTRRTVADVNHESDINDAQQQFNVDADPNNQQKYTDMIQKSYEKNSQGLSPLDAKKLSLKTQVAKIQIDNMAKKKWLQVDSLAVDKFIDLQTANPTDASLPRIKELLAQKVSSGHIDATTAYEKERKANADLGVNRINQDLYRAQTPEEVDAVTQRITSGEYEKGGVVIEPDKKKALLDIADRAKANTEKKVQAAQEEALVQNRMETIVGVASGKMALEGVDMKAIAEYDPQLAGTLTKVKDFMVNYNPKLPPQEQKLSSAGLTSMSQIMQMKSYAKSITDTFLQDDNKKLSDFVLRELEKKGDGLTSSVKLAAFANLAALKAKANYPNTPDAAAGADRYNAIKTAVRFLQASNPYLAPTAIGEFIVRNFLSGKSAQHDVMQEAKNTLRDQIVGRYKAVSKLPSLPNKIVDGDAFVEDIQSGINEFSNGDKSGDYADQPTD